MLNSLQADSANLPDKAQHRISAFLETTLKTAYAKAELQTMNQEYSSQEKKMNFLKNRRQNGLFPHRKAQLCHFQFQGDFL